MLRKTGLVSSFTMVALLVLVGCQSTTSYHLGKQEKSEYLLVLQPQGSGEWKTVDLSIRYLMERSESALVLSGVVEVAERYQVNYEGPIRLDVYLLFLDSGSQVLESARLVYYSKNTTGDAVSFEREFMVPDGAESISFAYEGTVWEYEGRRKNPNFFWHRPG